jgi:hypothetical protein
MLTSINLNPHVICFSEHYLTEQNLLIVNLSNYYLASNFSHINHSGGGVCIYIWSDLKLMQLTFLNFVLRKVLRLVQFKLLLVFTLL